MPAKFKEIVYNPESSEIQLVSQGSNKGAIWGVTYLQENNSTPNFGRLHFGSHLACCCSKDYATCGCNQESKSGMRAKHRRPTHHSQFSLIVDATIGDVNPQLKDKKGKFACKNIDYDNRSNKTIILHLQSLTLIDEEKELEDENEKFLDIVRNTDILKKIHDELKEGNNVLVHDEWGYQRAASIVLCYLIQYYYPDNEENVLEYFTDIMASYRPSVLGRGESGEQGAVYQEAFQKFADIVNEYN